MYLAGMAKMLLFLALVVLVLPAFPVWCVASVAWVMVPHLWSAVRWFTGLIAAGLGKRIRIFLGISHAHN